jgi:hypothetical protein
LPKFNTAYREVAPMRQMWRFGNIFDVVFAELSRKIRQMAGHSPCEKSRRKSYLTASDWNL